MYTMMVIANREEVEREKKRNGYSHKTRVEIPIFMQGFSQPMPTDPKKVFHMPGLLEREVWSADQSLLRHYPHVTDANPPLPVGWDTDYS